MKTVEWIDFLARGAGAATRLDLWPWLAAAALAGAAASAIGALVLIGPVPAAMFATAAPWLKLGYALLLGAAALALGARLALPLAPRRSLAVPALATVVAAMALFGAAEFAATPPSQRVHELLGHSWASCPWSIVGLSLPALAAALAVLRRGAPTRPGAAGFAAGILAGAAGAFGYAFACVEDSSAFIALWYTLGIALAGALGAALGPRVLRW